MASVSQMIRAGRPGARARAVPLLLPLAAVAALTACAPATSSTNTGAPTSGDAASAMSAAAPDPDPRVGLRAGAMDAGEATWNLRVLSKTPPSAKFVGSVNSDLAFTGDYVIQGSYNGYQVWDISNPRQPTLKVANYCPASQSDVSVYRNLLFVSAEGNAGRIDCGDQGVMAPVSAERIRGLRIFDIGDIVRPRNVANVQTCRGSHTHTVLADPRDADNVYVYVSGSSPVRPAEELPGCVSGANDPNTAEFRIEVVKVPLARPEQAAIVSSPRIFADLKAPPRSHGAAPDDRAVVEAARARGEFVASVMGEEMVLPPPFTQAMLDSIVRSRDGTGPATAADSATLRSALPAIIARLIGERPADDTHPGITQCHDITVYPAIGLAGGACEGYGLLLDIRDATNPRRIAAVSDSNFSYWHSATFNNDGTKILFTDEWGGGSAPKCRASDPKAWGANAIFTLTDGKMEFQSYYKLPAPQTAQENCVAHNGSLVPIPGRDVMIQSWYQGGISVFDWTDPKNPREIAFFDRGPSDSTRLGAGGSWSVYWYNGVLVSSEIARGLDIFEVTPSAFVSQNEIDAAKSVRMDYLNPQGQPKLVWPPTFALARAYVDQLERSGGLAAGRIGSVREALRGAERASGSARSSALTQLATQLDGDASGAGDAGKVRLLAGAVRDLAGVTR
jgi:hypothetical protein